MNRRAPIMNSHERNRILFLSFMGYSSRATSIFPKIDIVIPSHLCTIFKVNILLLSFCDTISYRTVNPSIIWTKINPTKIQDTTNSPISVLSIQSSVYLAQGQYDDVRAMTYIMVRREQMVIDMEWILMVLGYDLAQRTKSLGISTPTPQMANIVILYARSRSVQAMLDSKSIAIIIIPYQDIFDSLQKDLYHIMDPESVSQLVDSILQQNNLETTYKDIVAEPLLDRALGCMFGSIIGDCLGSYVEFRPKPNEELMEQVMQMNGGGTFDTQPGQGTDDTEMSLCLLHGLLHYQPVLPLKSQTLNLHLAILNSYIGWVQASPFDIGETTQMGIQIASSMLQQMFVKKMNPEQIKALLHDIEESIKGINEYSESNGYLMRCHPLAIFKAFIRKFKILQTKQTNQVIKNQISITHANDTCLQSGNQFIDIISLLIGRSNFGALSQIYDKWLGKKDTNWEWKSYVIQKKWMPTTPKIGWAKIAYTEAFNWLREITERYHNDNELTAQIFADIMKKTIQKGGDTDTNAAIVGSMVGAIFGFSKLPTKYLMKILSVRMPMQEFEKKERNKTSRPPFFQGRNGLINVVKMRKKFI